MCLSPSNLQKALQRAQYSPWEPYQTKLTSIRSAKSFDVGKSCRVVPANLTRLYSARGVLISGDCKRETGTEHVKLVDTMCVASKLTGARTVSVASDGESRRGEAFIQYSFKKSLTPQSPIYDLLAPRWIWGLETMTSPVTRMPNMYSSVFVTSQFARKEVSSTPFTLHRLLYALIYTQTKSRLSGPAICLTQRTSKMSNWRTTSFTKSGLFHRLL